MFYPLTMSGIFELFVGISEQNNEVNSKDSFTTRPKEGTVNP